jgi:hypothetical protein
VTPHERAEAVEHLLAQRRRQGFGDSVADPDAIAIVQRVLSVDPEPAVRPPSKKRRAS